MLCCVGLFAGYAVGQYLGGPWTFVAPAAGFGIGLAADMKFMKGHHHGGGRCITGMQEKKDADPVSGTKADVSRTVPQAERVAKT